jgi:lipooligosaccharide transport system permease protein
MSATRIPISPWNVYSAWRRHALVYRKTWLVNVLPPLSEPLLYLVAFGFGLSPLIGKFVVGGREVNYLQFVAPGVIAVGVLFQSFFEGAYGSFIRLRYQKTWQALLTAPLSYTEVFLGEWLWAATRGMIAGFVTGGVTVALGMTTFSAFAGMLYLIVLGSLLFAGVGMTVAGVVRTVDQINVPVFLFVVPMFTMCGTFFPRENLPWYLSAYAGLLPLAPLNDLMRAHLSVPVMWHLKLAELVAWAAAFLLIAWRVLHRQIFR